MPIHTPTSLSHSKIQEFKQLHEKKYHMKLTDEQAEFTAIRLMELTALIMENISSDKNPDVENN